MQTQTRLLALRRPQLRLYLSHNQNFRSEFRLICWKFLYRRLRKVFLLRCWKYRRRVRRINFKRIRKITTHRAILIKKKLNFFYATYRRNFVRYRYRRPRRNKTTKPGPRMVLHKKNFYRPIHNKGRKGYNVGIYPFTIRAKESYVFTTKLVELSRLAFSRPLKKGLRPKYKVGIYPYVSITKKPLQARMGKGKGKPSGFLAPIRIGETLLQLNQALHLNALKKLHKKVSFKLPIFTKFVIKTRTKKPFNVHREFHQAYTFLSKS